MTKEISISITQLKKSWVNFELTEDGHLNKQSLRDRDAAYSYFFHVCASIDKHQPWMKKLFLNVPSDEVSMLIGELNDVFVIDENEAIILPDNWTPQMVRVNFYRKDLMFYMKRTDITTRFDTVDVVEMDEYQFKNLISELQRYSEALPKLLQSDEEIE